MQMVERLVGFNNPFPSKIQKPSSPKVHVRDLSYFTAKQQRLGNFWTIGIFWTKKSVNDILPYSGSQTTRTAKKGQFLNAKEFSISEGLHKSRKRKPRQTHTILSGGSLIIRRESLKSSKFRRKNGTVVENEIKYLQQSLGKGKTCLKLKYPSK